jgi:hypothetical protein
MAANMPGALLFQAVDRDVSRVFALRLADVSKVPSFLCCA